MSFFRSILLFLLALLVPLGAGLPPVDEHRSPLTFEPDWRRLEPLQGSMSRAEFIAAMDSIYSAEAGGWRSLFRFGGGRALVRMDGHRPDLFYRIDFGDRELDWRERGWRLPSEMPPAPADRPLEDMRIAIDPGHLGGRWAQMEGRWFRLGSATPVMEGVMTLAVAQRLERLLEEAGAHVAILRPRLDPVTRLRPGDLLDYARSYSEAIGLPREGADLEREADKFFYRVAEIRARAERLEASPVPADLTICLHFNAAPWGNPSRPSLVSGSHLHVLVNGCYSLAEMREDDQRAEMLRRVLSRTHEVEIPLSETVARHCARMMRLNAFEYRGPNARPVGDSPYVWARNLLANRTFPTPVIYLEPYVMNSRLDYARIQAGAYEGTREFGGVQRINIFDEYAQAVAAGVIDWYRSERSTVEEVGADQGEVMVETDEPEETDEADGTGNDDLN